MPVVPTYPGVYVQEIPSGVRTITSASTSIAAFVGWTRSGPVGRPVRLSSWADFERRFGGFDGDSDLSYAVHQFFLNGGTDAYVARVAKDASAASTTLAGAAGKGQVLGIEALDEGSAGNEIRVEVSHPSPDLDGTFSLRVEHRPASDPGAARVERFDGLSMRTTHPRFVERIVGGSSSLVTATRLVDAGFETGGTRGGAIDATAVSASLATDDHTALRIQVDGGDPLTIEWTSGDLPGPDRLADLLAHLVSEAGTGGVTITATLVGNQVEIRSATVSEDSAVLVLGAGPSDAATLLGLTAAKGAARFDGSSAIRPVPGPGPGRLQGETLVSDPTVSATLDFGVVLDGAPLPVEVTATGIDTVATGEALLQSIAQAMQDAVRAARPSLAAFAGFSAEAVWDGPSISGYLLLSSGTGGEGSSVRVVTTGNATDDATLGDLGLLGTATALDGEDLLLTGGDEQPFAESDQLAVFDASRAERRGIYALESVEAFNLLCLPGITNRDVLAAVAAYAQERGAFMIVDAPVTGGGDSVERMVAAATDSSLPATDHAAVYFPWLYVADRERDGVPRLCPPCGTMAGIYARTDAQRGLWKTPAGIDTPLLGVQSLAYELTDPENGMLNPLGVNCLRRFPAVGMVPWGGRTLRGADQLASEYKYASIRRLALNIEQSIVRGTQWVVFEPNDEPLWAQIRLNVGAFMDSLFRQGAFQGAKASDAYFVHCDAKTNPQYDIDRGIVNIVVGFAPLKPVEFVVISIQQQAGTAPND